MNEKISIKLSEHESTALLLAINKMEQCISEQEHTQMWKDMNISLEGIKQKIITQLRNKN